MLGLFFFTTGCSAITTPQDLREAPRAESPNDALACPKGACRAAADFEVPTFDATPEAVMQAFRAAIAKEPRVELAEEASALDQLVFVQRSAVFRFPDTVWVQSIALPSEGASLIIYSRSNFGYSDLGVNKARVERWLGLLTEALPPRPAE